jgi:hypothetical protein
MSSIVKWIAGIASAVISAVLIWFITKPPAPKPPYSLSGKWAYTMRSDVSRNTYHGSLHLLMDGTNVSGEFVEDFFDKSSKGVQGALYGGDDLELTRDTSKNTTQRFSLTKKNDDLLVGTFWNVGPPETDDRGSFEITR